MEKRYRNKIIIISTVLLVNVLKFISEEFAKHNVTNIMYCTYCKVLHCIMYYMV